MRISMSFSPEQVDRLDEIMRNLKTRTFAGAQRLTELASDEHCQLLAATLSRAKQRAASGPPTPPTRRIDRTTTDAVLVDYLAGEMTVAKIARKHGVSGWFVYSLARRQGLKRKPVPSRRQVAAERRRAQAEVECREDGVS